MQRTGCTRLFCDYGYMEMGVAKSGFRFGRMFAIICGQNNRRGAGVVERGGLENRCGLRATVGSNPTLSAGYKIPPRQLRLHLLPDLIVLR
jgi:hypothetical protein